jgi:rRNA maturation endonuclease Nob1|tara:strand:+ start:540 stop:1274 length:735 start_codon:yes stop_codon:yes gene_type:complete
MPIDPTRNPLADAMFSGANTQQFQEMSNEDIVQLQKEQENRLIGSMMIQSIFLALALMLYESWSWGKFDQVWQSALLYGMLAFTFQASLYLLYRSMFEDSTNYRRQIKRMKSKNKRRMAQIKYEVDKQRTEWMLDQQVQQFQNNAMMAQVDGFVSPAEQNVLQQQYQQLQQTDQQVPSVNANMQYDLADLAKQLGLDRHRIGPIPMGPSLTPTPITVTQAPLGQFQVQQPVSQNTLDLDPTVSN